MIRLICQNDLEVAWDCVSKLKSARIDIVLDNAGFELYADLLFTLYLLTVGIAETVVLHPKSIPWYIYHNPPKLTTI
jgi:damage-control phosphatase, subfamily III